MGVPRFWLIAGPNGAGKTTVVQSDPFHGLLPPVHRLNADEQTLRQLRRRGYPGFHDVPGEVLFEEFSEASEAVFREVTDKLGHGEAVCVETVLSTSKYQPVVERTLALGGYFALVYVTVRSPDISIARVAQRVRQGGHDVPTDKVRARWHRSLEFLPWFAARASVTWVFDNSDSDPENPPRLIAQGIDGRVRVLDPEAILEVTRALSGLPAL